ncbi:hypothetical protein EDC01DRAFT_632111 [Geopyxis carbonaria]|nr:hypothetical protein EDC01DRAFT_632111 [Geopyxis carbonaria]
MDPNYNNSPRKNIPPGPGRQTSSSSMKRQTSGSWSSSSIDGKQEKKRSIMKGGSDDTSTTKKGSDGAISDGLRLNTQHDPRDDTIKDLKGELEKLRRSCTCVICQELLFEPFFFQCGHVYCYGCIVQWIGQATSKKKRWCPQCRELIKSKPGPAYLVCLTLCQVPSDYLLTVGSKVRDMVEIFVQRAELVSPKGSGSELRKQQKEMTLALKKDTSPKGLGLFRGLFDDNKNTLLAIRDESDEVLRCPACTWEVHGGVCQNRNCNARVRDARNAFTDDSESGSATEGESDHGIAAPDRWPESVMGEETAEETDDFDGYDDDGWEDEIESPGVRLSNNPINIDDDDDEEPVTNRARQTIRPHGFVQETDDDDDESDNDTEGSLAEFVVDDSPEVSRRNGRNRTGPPWALSSSPVVPERVAGPPRRNARPIIIDDDDDEDQSSLSEASEAPGQYSRGLRRGFHSARDHRSHISISSDYDDDEDQSLLSNGYQSLGGHQTASENEDEGIMTPPPRLQHRRNFNGSVSTPGSVFSVPEEEDEDEYGDADDSEDTEDADGDVRMSESDSRMSNPRQPNRRQGGHSRIQTIDLDSASESEVALSATRRQRRPVQQAVSGNNYFTAHQRNASGGPRNNNNARNRLSALIDPQLQNLFATHHQMLAEQQYNSLGGRTSSVSPARSLTPVQRDITGARRAAGSRTGSRVGSRAESRSIGSRDTTPVQQSVDNTPPPFSPLQPTEPPPQRTRQGTIEPTPSPGQIAPGSPASSYHSAISPSSRLASLSPRAGGSGWGIPSHIQPQVQRTASPGFGIRVRSRTGSRPALRNSASRTGLRNNSAQGSHMSSFTGGTGIAGVQGRHTPQQQQQNPPPRQQQSQEQTRSSSGMPPRPRYLTSEDVRARGQLAIQQRQQQQGSRSQSIESRSQSMEPVQISSPGRNNSGTGNGHDPVEPAGRGRRLGALIGGGAANSRGGGPMLVFGNENE